MTISEARKRLKIRETDPINKDRMRIARAIAMESSCILDISDAYREMLKKDVEAYNVLLKEG